MGNFIQTFEPGTPSMRVTWPKNAVIKTEILKTSDGRFLCRVKVNDGEFFSLPGTHPTEQDAQATLDAYVAENTSVLPNL